MNNSQARKWLDEAWNLVLKSEDGKPSRKVDCLVNSEVLSIRYAVLTQMLGKIANGDRSLLSLQLGTGESLGAWDARSFCLKVIVPWVAENHDVLGNSPDPYVNNPLRRPRLDEGIQQLRNGAEWGALVDFLSPLDSAKQDELELNFVYCLESVKQRLATQSFKYQIPIRISLPQMLRALEDFLVESSGGLRPLTVTVAMMKILGQAFSIFTSVSSQGLNEADALTGALGDVMCLDDEDKIILAVEVKDRALTLADVRSSTRKARASTNSLGGLLFVAPTVRDDEKKIIHETVETAWASGLNINQIDIVELANMAFALLAEEWRPKLLREIGAELDRRGNHAHRRAWHDLLSKIS